MKYFRKIVILFTAIIVAGCVTQKKTTNPIEAYAKVVNSSAEIVKTE